MAGTAWHTLVAGRKRKASEVNENFEWLQGHIVPMNAGVQADATYNLGTSAYNWLNIWVSNAYVHSLNPTTTAGGIAFGKAAATTDAGLDLSAMPKALYLPLLTTVQRDGLTPQAGFIIYNSTNSRMERYEGGQWIAMNSPIGFAGKAQTSTSDAVSNTILKSISGSGRIVSLLSFNPAAFTVVVDGTTYSITSASTNNRLQIDEGMTSTSFLFEGTSGAFSLPNRPLDISFKNSLVVGLRNIAATATGYLIYEVS